MYLYLFQTDLVVCYLVYYYSVTASPAQTVGPTTLIFDTIVGHDKNLRILYSSRSKVKVKKDVSPKHYRGTENRLANALSRLN